MLANYLIGLREGMEASLLVGILVACLVRQDRRDKLPAVWSGTFAAILLSVGFGALLTFGSHTLTFQAQEALGGVLSLVAVAFITLMVFWMASEAKNLKANLDGKIRASLLRGSWAVAVVAFLAVAREGLETTLFLWAAARGAGSTASPLFGALAGILTAVVLGHLIYKGALRLNLAKFFTVTGAFLVLIAAGVLSYGIHDLQEANILPGLGSLMFDASHLINPSGWAGTLLKGTVNFTPQTTWLQGVAWLLYVVPVGGLFLARTLPRVPRGRLAAA